MFPPPPKGKLLTTKMTLRILPMVTLWVFSFFLEVAAALIRLLVLENIFLIPSHDIYLLVGAYIKYRVAKMVQGRMTGKMT